MINILLPKRYCAYCRYSVIDRSVPTTNKRICILYPDARPQECTRYLPNKGAKAVDVVELNDLAEVGLKIHRYMKYLWYAIFVIAAAIIAIIIIK